MPDLLVHDLGLRGFAETLDIQRAAARARIRGALDQDLLLLVEHSPVVTLGRSSKEGHLIATPAHLAARGVELFAEVERGGNVTFHGPGQLVGYPIVDLKRHRQDLHWYLRQVEETLIRGLAALGIAAERREKLTGVWTDGRKIASIGVHARDWVTWHGFALNVSTDLRYFDLIVPCGIGGVEMTSVERELGRDVPMGDARTAMTTAFAEVFDLRAAPMSQDSFEALLAAPEGAARVSPLVALGME